jgi:beta-phosphoglucomutase-like phosphatase (HAD superfamily)
MKTGPFEAIIFDMDGVIVDSEPRHERSFREIFDEMGYGQTHGMDFPQYYGRSDRALWVDFVAKHQPAQSLEELCSWKQRHFIDLIKREKPIFTGLPKLVSDLAPRYKLAVASGSSHPVIDAILEMENLRRHFPIVVSVQDVKQGKPAPDVFLRAAELLGVDPKHCCVIEDSAAGVSAGKAAGMTVIAITNSLPSEKLQHADIVVSTYNEIEMILLRRQAEVAF